MKRIRQPVMMSWAILLVTFSLVSAVEKPEVPVVDGHLGRCWVDFTIKDKDRKPVYNAQIEVVVRYGPFGLRRMSLQVGTNSEGKARVAGLPEKKKPFEFLVTHGPLSKTVRVDSSAECRAAIEVNIGNQ